MNAIIISHDDVAWGDNLEQTLPVSSVRASSSSRGRCGGAELAAVPREQLGLSTVREHGTGSQPTCDHCTFRMLLKQKKMQDHGQVWEYTKWC